MLKIWWYFAPSKVFSIFLLLVLIVAASFSNPKGVQAVNGDSTPPVFNFTQSLSGSYPWPEFYYVFSITDDLSPLISVTVNFQYGAQNETYTVQPSDGGLDSAYEEFSSLAGFTSAVNSDVPYIITFETHDEEDNISTAVFNVTFTPDTLDPTVLLSDSPAAFENSSISIAGTATDLESNLTAIEFQLDANGREGSTPVDGDFNSLAEAFTVTVANVADGPHILYVYAKDSHDNEATYQYPFIVDTIAPSCASTWYNQTSPYYSKTITYTNVTCSDVNGITHADFYAYHAGYGELVSNDDNSIALPNDGAYDGTSETFTFTVDLSALGNIDGNITIGLVAYDPIGYGSPD